MLRQCLIMKKYYAFFPHKCPFLKSSLDSIVENLSSLNLIGAVAIAIPRKKKVLTKKDKTPFIFNPFKFYKLIVFTKIRK